MTMTIFPSRARLVAWAGIILLTSLSALPAQTDHDGSEFSEPGRLRVAPLIPAREEPLDLFVREIGGGERSGTTPWILRYGARGSLQRPGVLDIPPAGRAFVLHTYDIVAPTRGVVEVRRLPDYRSWMEFSPGTLAVPVSEDRFELLYGRASWNAERHGMEDLRLTAGILTIRGRGQMRIERPVHPEDLLHLEVVRGRFEVFRGERIVAVLGAGQTRTLAPAQEDRDSSGEQRGHSLPGPSERDGDDPFLERFNRERDLLEQRLHEATLLLFGGPLTGDTLTGLWDAVLRFGPLYGFAEANAQPGIVNPDLALHALGDTLRLLASFAWEAPEGELPVRASGR
jgi:hypothetical protein